MVYSANNEQGMEFRVHNTRWMPVDFEGLTLMMRPATTESGAVSMDRSSKAAISRMVQNKRAEQDKRAQLFPAHAGVILQRNPRVVHGGAFPRTRGGDPPAHRSAWGCKPFSPHTRG